MTVAGISWGVYSLQGRGAVNPIAGTTKDAKFGEIRKIFFFAAWRLGAINFVEVVLLNILSVRIKGLILIPSKSMP